MEELRKAELYNADATVNQQITLNKGNYKHVNIVCDSTTTLTFIVEISFDNSNWFVHYSSSAAENHHEESFVCLAPFIRVTSQAGGVGGDMVSLIIAAAP